MPIFNHFGISNLYFSTENKKCTFFYAHNCVVFMDGLNVVAQRLHCCTYFKKKIFIHRYQDTKKFIKYKLFLFVVLQVLQKLKEVLGVEPEVQEFVSDFEKGMYTGLQR